MFSIGEFSKITGLTIKTLRFYHDQGLLVPTHIDGQTGYRYYAESKVEQARVILELRRLELPLADIADIVAHCEDEADVLGYLERHQQTVREKLQQYHDIDSSLKRIIAKEQEARAAMENSSFQVEEKTVAALLVAGVRMRGKYCECGKAFGQIGKRFGRHICGKPLMLHYDTEYKEDDADFEVCMPIRKGESSDEVQVRELSGGRCVALLHRGPYEELGNSYAKIFVYINEKGYATDVPSREVYLKGPGMIFRGNPQKYLTEIQIFIKEEAHGIAPS